MIPRALPAVRASVTGSLLQIPLPAPDVKRSARVRRREPAPLPLASNRPELQPRKTAIVPLPDPLTRRTRHKSLGDSFPRLRASQEKETPPEKPRKGPSEWELGVGDSIRVLRDDLDTFLQQGFTDTSIYSPDIVFQETRYSKLRLHGLQPYLMAATLFRTLVTAYFDSPTYQILSFRQARDSDLTPDEQAGHNVDAGETEEPSSSSSEQDRNRIHLIVRWRLEGTPRPSLLLAGLHSGPITRSVFEGVSVYGLSPVDGKVATHTVLNIWPAPPEKVLSFKPVP